MLFLLLLAIILFAITRGIDEGITMHQPNPRSHDWFKWYHLNNVVEFIALILATILVMQLEIDWAHEWKYFVWTFIAFSFMSWEVFESAYSFTRFREVLNTCGENINVLDIFKQRVNSTIIHSVRIVIILVAVAFMSGHPILGCTFILGISLLVLSIIFAILWMFRK